MLTGETGSDRIEIDPTVMEGHELAQFNVARLKCSLEDPRVAEFAEAIDRIHTLAESSDGFVWRLSEVPVNPTGYRMFEDPRTFVTLSVWRDLGALKRYVWHTEHLDFYRRRRQWFDAITEPHSVMWWVREGHRPSLAEAHSRLRFLAKKGSTRHAFDWSSLADDGGEESRRLSSEG